MDLPFFVVRMILTEELPITMRRKEKLRRKRQDSQVMVGPMILQCVENFFVDRFFIGTDGYSTKMGFTNQDQMRAQAVRDMARQAEEVIVLTESEKFSKRGIVPLNLKDQVKAVITDSEIDSFYEAELISKRIQVIKA